MNGGLQESRRRGHATRAARKAAKGNRTGRGCPGSSRGERQSDVPNDLAPSSATEPHTSDRLNAPTSNSVSDEPDTGGSQPTAAQPSSQRNSRRCPRHFSRIQCRRTASGVPLFASSLRLTDTSPTTTTSRCRKPNIGATEGSLGRGDGRTTKIGCYASPRHVHATTVDCRHPE
jgi:hypothetical protein